LGDYAGLFELDLYFATLNGAGPNFRKSPGPFRGSHLQRENQQITAVVCAAAAAECSCQAHKRIRNLRPARLHEHAPAPVARPPPLAAAPFLLHA
jgi:hypothetical protein